MGKGGDAPKQQSTLSFKTPSARKQEKSVKDKAQVIDKVKQEEAHDDAVMTNGDGNGISKTEDSSDGPVEDVKPSVLTDTASSADEGNT